MKRRSAHRADVHAGAAVHSLDHGLQAFGGAEQSLGLLDVVPLLGLQSCLDVLLLPGLQEFQLLHSWRPEEDNVKRTDWCKQSKNVKNVRFEADLLVRAAL